MINTALLISLISALSAIAAAIISFKNYNRQKSIENENHFYKYKIDMYQLLLAKAYELLDTYQKVTEEAEYAGLSKKEYDKLANEIDDKSDEFRIGFNQYSIFFSKEIISELDVFFDKIEKYYGEERMNFKGLNEEIDGFYNQLEKIQNLMREDIGIESINHRLKKRISK